MSGQRSFAFRTWGGRRRGAGRKPKVERAGVTHGPRPEHAARHPVHVTMRATRRLPSLRAQRVFVAMYRAFSRTKRGWFRIIHFSVQRDHVHLLVEADDKVSLSRGVAGAAVRLARAVNRVLGRNGRVWGDRFHARALTTPREVRHGLVYVLTNWRKHAAGAKGLDVCSSARLFDGWKSPPASGPPPHGGRDAGGDTRMDEGPIALPKTWLARTGWKRYGFISAAEKPSVASPRPHDE